MMPTDLQIELYDKMVHPILLFGSEVWGLGNLDVLDRIVLNFLKIVFNMSTPNCMVYGEQVFFCLYRYLLPHDFFLGYSRFWSTW